MGFTHWFSNWDLSKHFTRRPAHRGRATHGWRWSWQSERLEDRTLLSSAEVFVMGLDFQVYAQKLDSAGNSAGPYFLTNAGQVKAITVGHDASNNADVFVIGMDNQVYEEKFSASGDLASPYSLVSPGAVKAMSVTNDAAHNPLLFVIGLDDQVWSHKFDAAGTSTGGYTLTHTGTVKAIQAAHDTVGNPLLFAIGTDNQVNTQKFSATGDSAGGYTVIPGTVKSMDVGYTAINQPELFVIGADDLVYAQHFDSVGNASGTYFNVPLGLALGHAKAISVTQDALNEPTLLAITSDLLFTDQVTAVSFDTMGNPSSVLLPTTLTGQVKSIDASRDAGGNLVLYAVGLDDQLYVQRGILVNSVPGLHGYQLTQLGQIAAETAWAGS